MERLDKYIASRSRYSRKDVKTLLREGKIRLNGQITRDSAQNVDENDTLEISGEPFCAPKHVYLMLHKPQGVVSASEDRKEKTVIDLVPDKWKRDGLFPAGRLDTDTTGFVLVTDDGEFAHRILSPKNHVPKIYRVTLRDAAVPSYAETFKNGVVLGDGTECLTAELTYTDDPHIVRVILHEGMYHQIKRMFASIGNAVTALHREAIGGVPLDDELPPGACRPLTETEIDTIEHA